ncbi:hypothetical protein OS493_002248 [Desmophyllum pertusum]|uniref:Uncharacterized protein n=1 Tax=Desmophyllum pertusum TaxID=174260 RepID=A0A9W9Z8I5_9CNID|nr:hypothetical protein OS493_002248 [Desmophyllum pertusum]
MESAEFIALSSEGLPVSVPDSGASAIPTSGIVVSTAAVLAVLSLSGTVSPPSIQQMFPKSSIGHSDGSGGPSSRKECFARDIKWFGFSSHAWLVEGCDHLVISIWNRFFPYWFECQSGISR